VKRVVVLQHERFEGPGTLREALAACDLRLIAPYADERVPRILDADGLVVLGGGMGVGQADLYPWLRDEMRLLDAATDAGAPVLGICLGSQLLAAARGGVVGKAPRKEIGWHGVHLEPAAEDDALFAGLPRRFTAFHWHGDAFTLPEGAVLLAGSAMTPLQAFRTGPRAWGIQFHLETDAEVLEAMLGFGEEDLRDAGADAAQIRARGASELRKLRELALSVFGRWAALL
jgi:GMP synthase-like glutamine amidotransferase